ncbi:hypothetical protein [Microbispora bryophytorum]|uniref:PH domain-containing protein n=1 Tax=Microbispora bryophytorum subsp. camponoti TaxID=1677852 RepID=A0ABR8KSW0_9ACTN|nr:hypothetical protein [Microbispora camponoti]MBD3141845.1 hypothetical protein [Microbispora camponoti]
MSESRRGQVVARKPTAIILMGVVGGALLLAGLAVIMSGAVIHDLASALFFSFVLGACTFVVWLIAWHSKIRATPATLFVDNFLIVHEIPWSHVKDIVLGSGIVVVLDDDEVIGSLHFGGSVLGMITGYPSYRRSLRRLQDALAGYKDNGEHEAREKKTYVKFPWIAALAWFLLYAIPSLLQL